mmetsp:Transcript_28575/g.60313  ORF Transcript_28575/g.60313 Transcript_28575/m.60313 type:complete len:344 (-) Transcript_28575:66-1097(-)
MQQMSRPRRNSTRNPTLSSMMPWKKTFALRTGLGLQTISIICLLFCIRSEKVNSNPMNIPERPPLVTEALAKRRPIYYFALGSNMSRKKVESRGLNGAKIEIQKMEPAVVPNYRLAFNLKGFPPIEPGMGSLEPVNSNAKALLAYEREECHGALLRLTPENYEKVMRSEGVGHGRSDQGYEEIIVDAYPYGRPKMPVKAVALRARDHVRLSYDPRPSARYMSILKEGAKELGLRPCYQDFLERHPVQVLKKWQRKQALFNILFMFSLSSILKWRGLIQMQTRLLFLFHESDPSRKLANILSDTMITLILMPGAMLGILLYSVMKLTGKMPESANRLFDFLDNE